MTGHEPATARTDHIDRTDRIDTSKPHPARVYDWFLGGKDNYPVDEELGKRILGLDPVVKVGARANRRFMHRATRLLAQQGIRQFLDIGTGIPTEPNLHQIAQEVAPESRIVYADNDPIVLRHAEALLRSAPEGSTNYLQADVREPERILKPAQEMLDFAEPVALSMVALMHFVSEDEDDAYGLVRRYLDALAPGSYLVLTQLTPDVDPEAMAKVSASYRKGGTGLYPRTHAEVVRFFDGLELLDPGVVSAPHWRPEPESDPEPDQPAGGGLPVPMYVGVARKR
jgi:SAM-dependent methyltransferase